MTTEYDLRILPVQAADDQSILRVLAKEKDIDPGTVSGLRVLRRSIDARQRTVFVNLRVRVYRDESPDDSLFSPFDYPDVSSSRRQAIVVGAGPGGLFAALRLIELGIRPIVVERGRNVHDRKKDLARISRDHQVNPESNYSFGEGGAGAFSDGKLYTRSKKRGNVEKILQVFCQFGAHPSILVDAHPHIGTDKLPAVIEAMREQIRESGGEVRFETRMVDLLISGHRVMGIRTADGNELVGPVILATGHSARDVYRLLHDKGIRQEAKSLAMGVRLEHPQTLIDRIQYHDPKGRGEFLPPAEYSLVTQVGGRGVYSFCMCPGGVVVPAASGPDQVVVNGMSASNRGSRWANAGLVVEYHPEDLDLTGRRGNPLGRGTQPDPDLLPRLAEIQSKAPDLLLLHFQEHLERCSHQQGGCRQTAPAQRMTDFVNARPSQNLPDASYPPGVVASPLHEWLPDGIAHRLCEGFRLFDRSHKGFLTQEAVLLGVETRTSSPVRIPRAFDTLMHVEFEDLYPCGEGAGYAGGIVSAAMDGERCAEMLAATGH